MRRFRVPVNVLILDGMMALVVFQAIPAEGGGCGAVLEVCAVGCPYTSIQAAIDDAIDGDTVLVLDGTYFETVDLEGKAITVRSQNGPATTTVDGGYASRVVTMASGEGRDTVVEGITITHGDGGVSCAGGASPTIRDCVIRDNTTTGAGGGVLAAAGSEPALVDCEIRDNSAAGGGGVWIQGGRIEGCTITGNAGGGVAWYLFGSSPTEAAIARTTIANNVGTGLDCVDDIPATLVLVTDTTVAGNTGVGISERYTCSMHIATSRVDGNGGNGLELTGFGHVDRPAARVERSAILRNGGHGVSSTGDLASLLLDACDLRGNSGAGVRVDGVTGPSSLPALTNCVVSGNRQRGVHLSGLVQGHLVNSTVAANLVDADGLGGAGILAPSGATGSSVVNSIVWGNLVNAGLPSQIEGVVSVTYSDVQGGFAGTGNVDLDPVFVDPRPAELAPTAAGGYHIPVTSPCRDLALLPAAPPDDVDGDPRPSGPGVDMGADEHGAWLFGDRFETGDSVFWSHTTQVAPGS